MAASPNLFRHQRGCGSPHECRILCFITGASIPSSESLLFVVAEIVSLATTVLYTSSTSTTPTLDTGDKTSFGQSTLHIASTFDRAATYGENMLLYVSPHTLHMTVSHSILVD